MTLKLTILGCGTSGGVPRIGGNWGLCDPTNPRNRRRRSSMLVQRGAGDEQTTVLIDTSPDLREQLLDTGVGWLDAVLFTHDHADHTHGIDELRVVAFNGRNRVRAFIDAETAEGLKRRFRYCFEKPEGSLYPPVLDAHEIEAGIPIRIDGPGGAIEAMPFAQEHGGIDSLGFRFGDIAYSSDVKRLSDESMDQLKDLDVWIVDALRRDPHPTHFNLEEALDWIGRVKPKRAVLTHMHVDMDYETLCKELPDGVEPAYDGMVLETRVNY